MSDPAGDNTGDPMGGDTETSAFLRTIAEDVRGESEESEQVAAILYRISDLYDQDENTTPEAIYRNMRNILRIKERGGIDRQYDE